MINLPTILGASLVGADTAIAVGIPTALVSLIAAGFTAYTAWYGAKRKGDTEDRQADTAAGVAVQSSAALLTERAQTVLMQTIDAMKAEMVRQDTEHEERITAMAARHQRDVAGLQSQIDRLREDHEDCMERNEALQRELAELRG